MSDFPQCSKICTRDKHHNGECNEKGSTKYHYKNLTPAQKLLVRETGFSYEWLTQFASHVLPGMLRLAERVIKLEA